MAYDWLDPAALARSEARDKAQAIYYEAEALRKFGLAASSGDTIMMDAIKKVAGERGWNAITINFDQLAADAHAAFQDFIQKYNAITQAIHDQRIRGNLTDQGMNDQLDQAATTYAWDQQITAITGTVHDAMTTADKIYQAELQKLAGTPADATEALVAEMRTTRAWARIKTDLDHDKRPAVEALRHRISNATDPYELRAIVEEAPTWAAAHDVPDAQSIVPSILEATHPDLADAAYTKRVASGLNVVVEHDANTIRQAIARQLPLSGNNFAYVNPVTSNFAPPRNPYRN